jgi:hypothetical protein
MKMKVNSIAALIAESLTDDLRRPPWRGSPNPLAGHCYVASEAAWHLLGAASSRWRPTFVKHRGVSHWYLENKDNGEILDITAGQFDEAPDYSSGIGKGFLTKNPSKRAAALLGSIRG